MGRNARRRADEKRARQVVGLPLTGRETKTLQRLRTKLQRVSTVAEFEGMLAQADPDRRHALRRLLEPMLPLGLPCCGPAELARKLEAQGKTVTWEHTQLCPSRRLVVLA